ncbi:MAG: DegT/DnrJ/EryC1/StrS family aminotransferase [Gammaproteobacteria bacterium]|jgi:dTDP-4-amino-4,6-dideoxygalactose transaminase|nr:DegT/DnrJ/EryC1/StrS family aminotransferase [Gammaproteobacteria bacterium]
MLDKPIYVTQPSLPPLEELIPYLEQIWKNKVLTNGGQFHEQLEEALCEYLSVPFISLFSNGTIALITALKALAIQGDVITTPYSFVATAHSLLWNGIIPVFVDIDPVTLNLDPNKIESVITDRTKAILPVHVYGTPCDVDAIDAIAKSHNLKVIYDAAHAFGVCDQNGSILNYGDLSVLSFHATKVFNTFEGGAIVCQDAKTKQYIDQLKNFGFTSETSVVQTGINGKMNEFNAAVGLLQLQYIDEHIEKRKAIDVAYREGLKDIVGIRCHTPSQVKSPNYSYFPIFVGDDYTLTRDELYEKLKANGINGRRYFYPLITEFPMYQQGKKETIAKYLEAELLSKQVICLPIHPNLAKVEQEQIVFEIRTPATIFK